MNRNNKELISLYIKAKDENKSHLMTKVFSEDATVIIKIKTDNISFPSEVNGLSQITDTLVSQFNKSYESIYTICFFDTLKQHENTVYCRCLVGMTEKNSKELRVGFGDYQWDFDAKTPNLVNHLLINIDNIVVFPKKYQSDILSWFSSLSYPWAQSTKVLDAMPNIPLLTDLRANMV